MSIFSQLRAYGTKCRVLRPRGFTLIELAAVFTIMLIISGVLLSRQSNFESTTYLRSLAYQVALTIRQAQVFGTTVREVSTGSSSYARAYGVFIPWMPTLGNDETVAVWYVLFADNNNDGLRAGDGSEDIKPFALGKGYSFRDLCALSPSGNHCANGGGLGWIAIMFRRPNPDACIASSVNPNACSPSGTQVYTGAQLELTHVRGNTRGISVSSTGAISLDVPTP